MIAAALVGIVVISVAAFGPLEENQPPVSIPQTQPQPVPQDPPSLQNQQTPSSTNTPAVIHGYSKDELLGKINPKKNGAFMKIESKYTSKTDIYMRADAYASFVKMAAAAKKDGIELTIVSAFRSFADQKGIWELKWNGGKTVAGKNLAKEVADPVERAKYILLFSSMPGTSRHHWGTDIDLNSLENSYFADGQGKKVYDWLVKHAAEYGYYQPYTPKPETRTDGYEEEKWHWSYLPAAKPMLSAYMKEIGYSDLNGFLGWETAAKIKVIEKYVMGINKSCLP
ncbi:MAG: hypothetical protein A2Y33_06360 [Spirochaetes bacterium GWF1_51_8]|nr:MAG: hypothetical protein A2Y33_06360 [Spirochaetes bacterium GWF1_51_8]